APPPRLPLTRLTLIGDRPPGYDGPALVLSNTTAFVTRYAKPTGEAIVLRINHAPKDGSHPYDAACDPSLSPSVTCADDGAGRTLVTDRRARTRELYVRHGAVDAVASLGTGASLPAARHLLTTLRPPTDHERAAQSKQGPHDRSRTGPAHEPRLGAPGSAGSTRPSSK
ncbi:hypothetical protein, partial [Streptomyces purpurogeneiscleroticus]|uniref:hypothetical protein n=1 Tax=Streptomyces purpurogeneiscleroticus TaxID=68259 RepID=UPI001CC10BA1